MVITLLPVLVIEFPHLLIAITSCVKSFFIKSVLPETGCLHYLLPPPRNESAVEKLRHYTQFIPEKARTSRFHSSFIMYALRNFQQITFFTLVQGYMLYTIIPIIRFIIVHFSLSLFFIHLCEQLCSCLCITLFCLLHVLILCICVIVYSSIEPLAAIL